MSEEFRCTLANAEEPMAGTAPTDAAYLLVEQPGGWGRDALQQSRLPESVRSFLGSLPGVQAHLIRRPGGGGGPGVRVYAAWRGADPWVETGVLADVEAVLDLDTGALATGATLGLERSTRPAWFVCTNGRRDRCCAEIGRPIAAALAQRWEHTWEINHLGGHRFAGTLLALPSGVVLGRLAPARAVAACADLAAGRYPVALARGTAGLTEPAQVAELHLRDLLGRTDLGAVTAISGAGDRISCTVDGIDWELIVRSGPGPQRRLSCAEAKLKPVPVHRVESVRRSEPGVP